MTNNSKPTPQSVRRNTEKKVWRFITAVPDTEPGTYVCVQELEGDWGTPNENGHNSKGWKDAEHPPARRVVFMRRNNDGSLTNMFGSGYTGDKYTIRDSAS